MRTGLIVLATMLLACCWVTGASAVDRYVPSGGALNYPTIQAAIDASNPSGDVIHVAPGYYPENAHPWCDLHINKSLDLIGAGSGSDVGTATIVGLGSANGVEINGTDLSVRIEGITFTKRTGQAWASGFNIRVGETASTFTSLVFHDVESAYATGRNVFIDGNGVYQSITVEDCSFHDSGAWGFSLRGIVNGCTITNSHFDYNGTSDPNHGIGFDIDMPITVSSINITGGSFSHNKAKGINLVKTANATFTGITADSNSGAPAGGFGVSLWEWVSGSSNLTFTNSSFSNNSTDGFLFGTEGACSINDVSITGCKLNGNGRDGVLLYQYLSGTVTGVHVTDCDLSGNSVKGVAVSGFTADVDASGNWWGSFAPATVAGKATAHVDYTPWLGSAYDLGGHSPGFEGDFSTLWVGAGGSQTQTTGRIQEGVDRVSGSTVNIAAGIYQEQVEIARTLTLAGAGQGGTVVQSPATLAKYFLTNKPIIYVHGVDGVVVKDLTIDGLARGNANYRFDGIAYYNAGGTIQNCEVKGIRNEPIDGAGHGVGIYAYTDVAIARVLNVTGCTVYDYQKNGMALNGEYLTAHVDGCHVTGYGPAPYGLPAQNGIQLGWGSTGTVGTVSPNIVTGHSYTPHDWAASGILITGTSGTVEVKNNTVSQNSEGIYCFQTSATIASNSVDATQAGTGVSDYWGVICDPGVPSSTPKPQPFDEFPDKSGRASYTYAVNGNVIDGDDGAGSVGLEIMSWNPDCLALTGSQNKITDFDYGVQVDEEVAGLVTSVVLNWNSIYSNVSYGLYNNAAVTVDARYNWWGDASGPNVDSPPKRGSGDRVSTNVDFDPWIGTFGGENIVCVPDPKNLTVANPTGTVDVNYLGGGGGLMYGYSLKFTWESEVSTAPNKVTQGTLLNSTGTTFYWARTTGTNEITVDCALLGDEPGVTGAGTMFTIEFTGLSVGTSPVDVTVLEVRDKDNNPITGFLEDDGLLIVDISKPVVSNVKIWNDTLATDDYIKNGDLARLTATVTDDGPPIARTSIWANLSGLRVGGAAVNPDTYDPGTGAAVWNAWAASCSPPDGTVMVTVDATDVIGNPAVQGSDAIIADNTKPTAVTGFDASPAHEECVLAWTMGIDTNPVSVTVRRLGDGQYPTYAYLVANWPNVDAHYPSTYADGTEVYNGAGTGVTDAVVPRDIYYYQAFCYDAAMNYGLAASTARDLATNYWLGDVANVANNWIPDGYVSDPDIVKLSGTYGQAPTGDDAQCNVGPTVHPNNHRLGLPKPDAMVQFEDLMIFAMNYYRVAPRIVPLLSEPGSGELALSLQELSVSPDGEVTVALRLDGNVGDVKGISTVIAYDPSQLEFVTARLSDEMVSPLGDVFFWHGSASGKALVDLAVLGTDVAIGGSGDVAVLTFRALTEEYSLGFEQGILRGVENEDLTAELQGFESKPEMPTVFRLVQNSPNPFNPVTTVKYEVPFESDVTIQVYDVAGRAVRTLVDGSVPAGRHQAVWDGRNDAGESVGSGVYFCTMEAPSYHGSQKMMLLK